MNLMREKRGVQQLKLSTKVSEFNLKELTSSISLVDYPKKFISDAINLYETGKTSLKEFNKYIMDVVKLIVIMLN